MTDVGYVGFGSTVTWGGTLIGYCKDIPLPSLTVDKIDNTNQDTTDGWDTFLLGMGHGGDISFDFVLAPDNAGQAALWADIKAKTKREMVITGPAAAAMTMTFNAGIIGLSGVMPYNDTMMGTLTVGVDGAWTLGVTYVADLSGLTITTATLLPSLTASTYDYTATTTGTSVTVTPTCDTADSIEVYREGTLVSSLASGGTSSAIAISGVGTNVAITVRVKRDDYASRDYNVTLVKTA